MNYGNSKQLLLKDSNVCLCDIKLQIGVKRRTLFCEAIKSPRLLMVICDPRSMSRLTLLSFLVSQ